MRKRPPRWRKACLKRDLRPLAAEKNDCWSMDFMSDELFDGHRIRLLTIVDNHTRESLVIYIGQRIRGCEVVEVLERIVKDHGRPRTIRVENGPEFITLDFSRPGKEDRESRLDSDRILVFGRYKSRGSRNASSVFADRVEMGWGDSLSPILCDYSFLLDSGFPREASFHRR